MPLGIDAGLQKINRMPVDTLPVPGDAARHLTQNVRGQMRNVDPRHNEIARMVGEKTEITPPHFRRPANEAVAGSEMPRGRGPG
jgi:hypothetical protein